MMIKNLCRQSETNVSRQGGPKQIQMPKIRMIQTGKKSWCPRAEFEAFEHLILGFVSNFGIRI